MITVWDKRGQVTALFGPNGELYSALQWCDGFVVRESHRTWNGILVRYEIRDNPYANYVL